ncbi:LysR family substrate-binding domain-containing protein [Nocardioides sp. Kera G14]|uniref:LysR family substrate-binding domain-containing protein n=1 Tax=Nocardioides sp. Kera G14 TaxID=2884264 RepID=UPI001D12F335|nr:LysR family substrate-binding domain-containing protein [Nocardioides sp. Kera G14]UDY25156.1 LysR family substrate-binding domain-containing protein [Nocardioides sp. Kera G14]
MTFRLGYVTGATPDKWARAWRDRSRESLELVPLDEADQLSAIREGKVDMALVRLPLDTDGLHLIRLYDEVPVVVAGVEHFVAAADEVSLSDLDGEQLVAPHASGWQPSTEQLPWPPMGPKDAIETVAAGTGVVLVPMSVGRLFRRKDTVQRPVTDLDPTTVGLAWLKERDDERTQAFVGIVRGRTANSSRG